MNFSDFENVANSSSGKIMHSAVIDTVASVIGWMYFAAWTLSFYPQVYTNWRRKRLVVSCTSNVAHDHHSLFYIVAVLQTFNKNTRGYSIIVAASVLLSKISLF